MSGFNKRFRKAIQVERQTERIEKRIKKLNRKFKKQSSDCKQLEAQYEKEAMDVEELDKITVRGIISTLKGSQDKRREKEVKERLDAKLRLEACRDSLVDTEIEIEELEYQLEDILLEEEGTAQQLLEKERKILRSRNQSADELIRITQRQATLDANKREVEQAIRAGQEVLKKLSIANKKLSAAANWGTIDMVGGGFFVTMAKHSALNESQALLRDAQRALSKFQRELKDVDEAPQINFQIDSSMKFWDLWGDGFFIDLFVQDKIQRAKQNLHTAYKRVEHAVNQLKKEWDEENAEIEKLTDQYRDVVGSAKL